ncbi:aminotransferase class IV [Belliella sp. R4-6]|uniref:branched-chain-amino-acid transaminase n=1 Tax=Belliella alkalica TaxID=1730871 RepID=A0ABS9VFH3_9BACT|nr:aminotransferase class IV [Belliella alkalica]MCH7415205.1 aminotransferase class IV [Belliella alkalica]
MKKRNLSDWVREDVHLANRAFLFADGLFETMVFSNGKIRFGTLHFERLLEGCKVLGLSTEDLTSIELLDELLANRFGQGCTLRIRWNVFRSGQGKYTPQTDSIEESIQIQSFSPAPSIKHLAYFHKEIFLNHSPWSHCKTLNALTYVMANRDRAIIGMDEVILLNYDKYVSEAGAANIFWYKNDVFYTPSLGTGCISGIGRRIVIEDLKSRNIEIIEGFFEKEVLFDADSVFVSNVTGISYLSNLEGEMLGQQTFSDLNALFNF